MRLTTPEIVWHNKQPLFSVDFHRGVSSNRLATGGADNDVKIWKVSNDDDGEKLRIQFVASLTRHTKAVNVVRFSPDGEFLASAGDDTVVHIWRLIPEGSTNGGVDGNLVNGCGNSSPSKNKENWSLVKMLRGHLEDIYDLCWSPDSSGLISGSVDNTVIVWDLHKGQQIAVLKESRQYIQGVAWDPLGEFVTALSTDRNLRVYSVDQKFRCLHTINKLTVGDSKNVRLWVDEVNSFFRRLTFTPDGSFLIAPAGRFENEDKVTNATYIFARNNLSKPVLQLPGGDKASVVVRCCPVLFELKKQPEGPSTLTSLPYRMVYAVASLDAVLLYDTQHTAPFAYIAKIHYSGITDLAWSDNGLTLVITSSDCYCTIVTFDPNELGVPLPKDKLPPCLSVSPKSQFTSLLSQTNKAKSEPQTDKHAKESQNESSPLSQHTVDSATRTAPKPRRIRPTLVSSITSPDGKTATPTLTPSPQTTPCKTMEMLSPTSPVSVPHSNVSTSSITSSLTTKNEGICVQGLNPDSRLGPSTPRRVSFITLESSPRSKTKSVAGTEKMEDDSDCVVIE